MAMSPLGANSSNALAADARSLNALRLDAGKDSPAAIKEAAAVIDTATIDGVARRRAA